MKRYNITITGETPLLMHHDNLTWADYMKAWLKVPGNKAKGGAGDDRVPAFRWIGCLYVEAGKVVIPSDNLMTVLREGGKKCPTGNGKQTFKAITQSGIVVDQSAWPLLLDGREIPFDPIKALQDETDFSVHTEAARGLGFELFCKRARVNKSKHVRVRPRFDRWSARGTLTVLDDRIKHEELRQILTFGGAYTGLCDWRPGSPESPGPFGKFSATLEAL